MKIHTFLMEKKKKVVESYDIRADYKQVMVLKDYDDKELVNLVKEIRVGSKNLHELRQEDEADYIRRRDQIHDFNHHIEQQGEKY